MPRPKVRKIKRIKMRDTVSAGVGSVLPGNPHRPEVELGWWKDAGVLVKNLQTTEEFVIPWSNLVEVVLEEPEDEQE